MMTTWNRALSWVALSCLIAVPGAAVLAQQPRPDDVRKKLEDLRKEIEDLRKLEKTLLEKEAELLRQKIENERATRIREQELKQKEAAEKAKREAAEKAKHYIKVEIRGKLVRQRPNPTTLASDGWRLLINEVDTPLSFQGAKGVDEELLKLATKFENQHVILTGTLNTKQVVWNMPPGMHNPGRPMISPGFPPGQDLMNRQWHMIPSSPPRQPVVVVSIKAAE